MGQRGGSLIEVLVVLLICLILVLGLYQLLEHNQQLFRAQQQITIADNQVRTAMETIVRTLRSAGNNKRALPGVPRVYAARADLVRVLGDMPVDSHDPGDSDADGQSCNDGDGKLFGIVDCDGSGVAGDGDNENENGDERLNDAYEDVTFLVNSNRLILRQFNDDPALETGDSNRPALSIDPNPPAESDQVIANNITALSFQYFSSLNTPIAMSGSPAAVPAADLHRIKIVRVTLVGRTADRDRSTSRFHTIQLTSDVKLRNQ